MARAPLPIETWGTIRRTTTAAGTPAAIAYYRDLDGKRRRLLRTGPSHPKAEAALKEALRDRMAPANDYLAPNSKLSQLAEAWLADLGRSKKAPATIARYRSVVSSHINEHVGEMRIQEASVPRLQRILDLAESASGVSQARILAVVLTGMFSLAVRHGAARDNPAKHLLVPVADRKAVRAPSEADLAELYRRLTAYDAVPAARSDSVRELVDFADFMLATGCRIGEVLALCWDSVDLDGWTVSVGATLTKSPGQGLMRKEPKTRSSVRTLHLPEFVRPMLARRRVNSVVAWVFPGATGGPRWPENVRQQWRDALKDSSVSWMTPHDLRKAVATALGVEGAMKQLGHANLAVADRHYVESKRLRPDVSEVLDRLASARGNGQSSQ